ncbi:MAG: hypothetical protein D6702_05105 [Planctomycetota bacterium]|nr:MAG: hypothetical protein D6702_05105 [Planctomycetota bacterium]
MKDRPGFPIEDPELAALAEELRAAWPDPPLSPGFLTRLEAELPARWTWRRALRQNRLLRTAAALLVTAAASVPVMAVVSLLGGRRPAPPPISFEPAPAPIVLAAGDDVAGLELEPPTSPDPAEVLDRSWIVALDRLNRLRRASFRWHRIFPPADAGAPADALPAGPIGTGLGLRLGLVRPEEVPVLAAPSAASAVDLWLELERRLAGEDQDTPGPDLADRVRRLWNDRPGDRPWLAGWIWILDGRRPPELAAPLPLPPAASGVSWTVLDRRPDLWPAD